MTFELGVYSFGNTPLLSDGSRGPTAQVNDATYVGRAPAIGN